MKLVNETRQSEGQTSPLKAKYNLEAAERSFDKFVEKGGYYEGWYNDGIDVDGEADIVAEDVRAGKRANEVGYGRQDVNFEDVAKGRKTNREHGKASRELDFLDFMEQQTDREVLANAFESVAQNDVEKAKLKDYRENIDRLNAEEEKLMKLRAEIKELSFAKGARDISKIASESMTSVCLHLRHPSLFVLSLSARSRSLTIELKRRQGQTLTPTEIVRL